MNLIVFDLEWNMGNAPKTFNYHGAELTLRGEIIQIGAVRVDENGDVLDTFEMTLRPRIFRKLHWRIAEVTGLSQGDLEAGVPIAEGLRRFQEWAGPDAEFAEWGLDDVPVLKQNLFLYNMDESWPSRWYDLQQIFLKNFPRGEGEGLTLESVVDRLGIEHDGDFHNALDDAGECGRDCRTAQDCRLRSKPHCENAPGHSSARRWNVDRQRKSVQPAGRTIRKSRTCPHSASVI